MTESTGASLLDAIHAQAVERAKQRQGIRTPLFEWALRVPEPKTGKLDFDRFPFQKELYQDSAATKEVVIMKSTQVGVSAYLARWVMYWADVKSVTALYVFPKLKQMYDFADARVRASILESEYLLERIPNSYVQNKGLKQIGGGFVYFRGSESKADLDSVDADVLALDEYDTLTQAHIPDAERRLSGSQLGLIRRVGVPSTPNWGIDRLYEESDQRNWMVRCGGCNEWQAITFEDNLDVEKLKIVCRKCRKDLDVKLGEWVATFTDRDASGYHIPRLIVPETNLKAIVAASLKTNPSERAVHFNKDLAIAYAPEEGRLSDAAIQAAQSAGEGYTMLPSYTGSNLVTMGVDVASARALNVRISEDLGDGTKRALWMGEVENFDHLSLLMERYAVKMCAIDHLPEGRLARSFAERFPGRVYLVVYDTTKTPRNTEVLRVNEDSRLATVRRVEAIDATFEQIRLQRNKLPADLPEGYVRQLQALIRVAEKDEIGRVAVSYRSTGADDYAHAEVYDLVAGELMLFRQASDSLLSESFRPLEDMLEFQRADLSASSDDVDYSPGPEE